MKSPPVLSVFLAAGLASAAVAAELAPGAAPVPRPMPVLHRDGSALSDAKPGLVLSYADVVEPVQKTVVTIVSSRTVHESVNPMLRQFFGDQLPEREGKEEGLGSGVIVSSDGYILTNNHVIEGAETLKVTLSDNRDFTCKVIGTDPKTDIAVVKIDARDLPAITLADSDKIRVGDIVFAVGNPLEVGQTVTMGIVSAKGRQTGLLDGVHGYENFIQTDAAINLGNSGGPLLDARGRLIGINTALIEAPGSESRGNIGIGFAIPANMAISVMQSLIATGTVARGYLGIDPLDLTSDVAEQLGLPKDASGVVISTVPTDGPAAKAGLRQYDVILSVNDQAVSSADQLHLMIGQMLPGAEVTLKLVRDGKPLTVALALGKADDNPDELVPGLEVSALTDDLRRKFGIDPRVSIGLVITKVADDAPSAGLQAGMVILSVNRVTVTDLGSARGLLHPGRNLLFIYDRGGHGFVVITVK
jgi:serine protease Do